MARPTTPDFARVLDEHQESATSFCKGCDWQPSQAGLPDADEKVEFGEHVAEELTIELNRWLASNAARAAATAGVARGLSAVGVCDTTDAEDASIAGAALASMIASLATAVATASIARVVTSRS